MDSLKENYDKAQGELLEAIADAAVELVNAWKDGCISELQAMFPHLDLTPKPEKKDTAQSSGPGGPAGPQTGQSTPAPSGRSNASLAPGQRPQTIERRQPIPVACSRTNANVAPGGRTTGGGVNVRTVAEPSGRGRTVAASGGVVGRRRRDMSNRERESLVDETWAIESRGETGQTGNRDQPVIRLSEATVIQPSQLQ